MAEVLPPPPVRLDVRHGKTIANEFRCSRRTSDSLPPSAELPLDRDLRLTPEGAEQALQLGKELAEVLRDSSYTIRAIASDLPRAMDTAFIVLGVLTTTLNRNISLTIDPRLREVGQGLTDAHIVTDHLELAEDFDNYWPLRLQDQRRVLGRPIQEVTERMRAIGREYGMVDVQELQGDSLEDVRARSEAFLEDEQESLQKPGQITLVFSHHQWISIASMPTIGRTLEDALVYVGESRLTPNCRIVGYTYRDGKWELIGWGKTANELFEVLSPR